MSSRLLIIVCSFLFLFQACKKEEAPTPGTPVAAKEKIIEIKTDLGVMYIWLYKETPHHRDNFLTLAQAGFYNNTTFHRIIPGFMIQGGDPNSKDNNPDNDGTGGPGYTIPAEFVDTLKNKRGAVATARLPDNVNPEKASSGFQFFINVVDNPFLDGNYTVFGMVIKGIEVADAIVSQPAGANDRPITDIPMEVTVLEKTKAEILTDYGYDVN